MLIAEQIKAARIERGLTQADIAAVCGVRENVISAWENGRTPHMRNIPALAKALGISPNELLGWDESRNN